MTLFRSATIVAVLVGVATAGAFAGGRKAITGKEEGIWGTDSRWLILSVVYADVVSVKDNGPSTVRVVLNVRATLAGAYEAAARPTVEADVVFHARVSAIPRPPAPKSHVVVVLAHWLDRPYGIVTDWVLFMPGESAIVEVANFEDPVVTKLISRLRELRAAKPTTKSP